MTTRQQKLKELLKEEISDIFLREFKDPRLGFITIIDAEITPDLQHAKVFVSVMGSDEVRAEQMAILKRSQHFVRQAFGKRVHMKTLPDIQFVLDTSVDKSVRLLELFEQVKHEGEKRSDDES
ncbi:MAG: 30S ribosome-binding factor RbfA [Armatimonadetes bacterium]|nr:30S ribosome-binding factor RbfA [Armatimonadota bacterium]